MFLTNIYFYLNFTSHVTIQKYLLFFFYFGYKKNLKLFSHYFSFSHFSREYNISLLHFSPTVTVQYGVFRFFLIGFLLNFTIN
jgi:hypothetical protein